MFLSFSVTLSVTPVQRALEFLIDNAPINQQYFDAITCT